MNWALLTRGVSSLAFPAMFGVAWLQRRRQRSSDGASHSETGPAGRAERRPSPRDFSRMMSDDERLTDLDLRRFRLKGANLTERNLSRCDLTGTDLRRSDLQRANLSECTLDHADLSGASLTGAVLTGASLTAASLWKADLRGADLGAARNIVMANIKRAVFDDATVWPVGIDPGTMGAIRVNSRRHDRES